MANQINMVHSKAMETVQINRIIINLEIVKKIGARWQTVMEIKANSITL